MKRCISFLLVLLLLFSCVFTINTGVYAAKKAEQTRAIAIVFDNSGSMYIDENKAWCRATYAMEVFASMLNKGDTLQIYPMHPVKVDGKEYTMDKPLTITDSKQGSTIRNILTPKALGTPIESIDAAGKGLSKLKADSKYMIVLTDGDVFYKNGAALDGEKSNDKPNSKKALDSSLKKYAGKDMTVMYLGIGKEAIMPKMGESESFSKKKADNSENILASLTEMCNQIFGRDTLPETHLSGKKIKLDLSISKMIVFVQGKNVSDLKVKGSKGEAGTLESSTAIKYGTAGCSNYESIPDKSLQGMMVTYTNCAVGDYSIDFKGTDSSIEVYYEPDADLDFVFTDADGNLVDPNALYEGEYKVSFGMKDAKTDQLISSNLLGKPHYEGSYFINGKEYPFSHDGQSGEVPVSLSMDDAFDANLTVTYLSDYTITKNSTDFGWPEGGIKVAARPAGDLKLKISGGDDEYSLQTLEKGKPFKAEVYYQGNKLTGKELESVKLKWNPENSYAEIKSDFADDHYNLTLHYKDPKNPSKTICGECKVPIKATYAAKGSDEAKAQATLTYTIDEDASALNLDLFAPDDYIVIADLNESRAVEATVTVNGKSLSAKDFKSVKLQVDCGGIEYKVTPDEKNLVFLIKLLPTDDIAEGDYPIKVTAVYTDNVGREVQAEDSLSVTLSNTPLWVKWLIGILLLILLILIIWRILHQKVLPKRVRHKTDECYMSMTGKNVTEGADFIARRSGKQLSVKTQYNGNNAGINISNIKPGKESYLYKPQQKRSILIDPKNVKMFGDVTYADVNGVSFVFDKNEGKLVPEDPEQGVFKISDNANISFDGRAEENGRTRKFHAEVPITFRKK